MCVMKHHQSHDFIVTRYIYYIYEIFDRLGANHKYAWIIMAVNVPDNLCVGCGTVKKAGHRRRSRSGWSGFNQTTFFTKI